MYCFEFFESKEQAVESKKVRGYGQIIQNKGKGVKEYKDNQNMAIESYEWLSQKCKETNCKSFREYFDKHPVVLAWNE